MEYSTAIHAETAVIAQAAAQGVSTQGASLYVTTFPCPYCARLIAHSRIKRLFVSDSYATLGGQKLLEDAGIAIIKVEIDVATKEKALNSSRALPYPNK